MTCTVPALLGALSLALALALVPVARPAHAATQLCGATQTVGVNGGEYIAQNNVRGATTFGFQGTGPAPGATPLTCTPA
jgi:uncharacterized membrane protein